MNPRTILIVDDDPQVVSFVERALQNAQYQTLSAFEGAGALKILERETVDCIVTDLEMPQGIGGIDLFIQLRQSNPDLPIIVISGHVNVSSEAFERLATQFGVRAALQKPFNPEELVAAVDAALGSSGR